MKQLKFGGDTTNIEHFLKSPINLTVRKGIYWGCALKEGESVELVNLMGDHLGNAVVFDIHVMRIADIPEKYLEDYEHNDGCRTREGLIETLEHVYSTDIVEEEIVTLLFFLVVSEDGKMRVFEEEL